MDVFPATACPHYGVLTVPVGERVVSFEVSFGRVAAQARKEFRLRRHCAIDRRLRDVRDFGSFCQVPVNFLKQNSFYMACAGDRMVLEARSLILYVCVCDFWFLLVFFRKSRGKSSFRRSVALFFCTRLVKNARSHFNILRMSRRICSFWSSGSLVFVRKRENVCFGSLDLQIFRNVSQNLFVLEVRISVFVEVSQKMFLCEVWIFIFG